MDTPSETVFRKLILRALLLLALATSFTALGTNFEDFERLVHIIKIKSSKHSATQGRGTGFVVGKPGLLVTNYHVVSGLFRDGKANTSFRAFVRIGKKEFLAKIIKVDILNDLALIKIPYTFSEVVSIRTGLLELGEKIYALGYHEKEFMAINQGTFNNYLKSTENELMAISCSLNLGMSGGPIIDVQFRVVGVTVLKSGKEADGYGINAERLATFLKTDDSEREIANVDQIINQQIKLTYDKIISAIQTTKKVHHLNRWELINFEDFMKCGEFDSEYNPDKDRKDKNKNQILVKTKICTLDPRKVPLAAMGTAIKINYLMANIKGTAHTNDRTFYNYMNDGFAFHKYRLTYYMDDNEYQCQKSTVANKSGLNFRVSICLFKYSRTPSYLKEGDYFKYEVKAITMTKNRDDLILRLQFSGSKEIAKNLINAVLGGVRKRGGN